MSNKGRLPIAVICGGEGAEREISLRTAEYIISGLRRIGEEPITVEIDARGLWWLSYMGSEPAPTYPVRIFAGGRAISGFLQNGMPREVAGAIPALHGDMGEDGAVQGALTCAGISFVGARVGSSAVLFDKAYAKVLAEHLGIPTVAWFLYAECGRGQRDFRVASDIPSALRLAEEIGYPLFVKPCNGGSSIGASVATDGAGLASSISSALRLGGRVIVEKYLSSPRELECAYLEGEDFEIFSAPGGVSVPEGFYSFDKKYAASGAEVTARADIPESVALRVKDYARRLCRFSSLSDLGRLDFFLTDGGELYFNEVNTFPGMTETSLYPKMLELEGVGEAELFRLLSTKLRGA